MCALFTCPAGARRIRAGHPAFFSFISVPHFAYLRYATELQATFRGPLGLAGQAPEQLVGDYRPQAPYINKSKQYRFEKALFISNHSIY